MSIEVNPYLQGSAEYHLWNLMNGARARVRAFSADAEKARSEMLRYEGLANDAAKEVTTFEDAIETLKQAKA